MQAHVGYAMRSMKEALQHARPCSRALPQLILW